jgi:hypothetical protein
MTTRIITGDCRAVLAAMPAESVHMVVTSPPIEILAYAAGVIDSDGSIGIRRSTYSMRVRKESKHPVFSARISIKQVEPEAIDLLKQAFGGSGGIQRASTKHGKPFYYWEIHSRAAIICLRQILPYLLIKRKQAANCIALYALVERSKRERVAFGRGHAGAASRDPNLTAEMEALYVRAKDLNLVGIRSPG